MSSKVAALVLVALGLVALVGAGLYYDSGGATGLGRLSRMPTAFMMAGIGLVLSGIGVGIGISSFPASQPPPREAETQKD